METTTVLWLSVITLIAIGYLYLLAKNRKLIKLVKVCEGKQLADSDDFMHKNQLPVFPAVERSHKSKNVGDLDKQFIGWLLSLKGIPSKISEGEKAQQWVDANYTSTTQLLQIVGHTVTQMYRNSPHLLRFVNASNSGEKYLSIELASGECVFKKGEHPRYQKLEWHLRMTIFNHMDRD